MMKGATEAHKPDTLHPIRFPIPAYLTLISMLLGMIMWWAYHSGLAGPFLLDDYATLPRLGRFGGVDDLSTLLQFLAGDITGRLGRPIALLSFALNSPSWPADPWAFKFTNLVLHGVTGGVLFLVLMQILWVLRPHPHNAWLALACTAFWLMHPMQVSTVLYVVQRMTQLSALFVLLAMAMYLHGRALLPLRPGKGQLWMAAAVVVGAPLATLSKENGALLPLLLWLTESILHRSQPHLAAPGRLWVWIFLGLPSLALFVLLALNGTPAHYSGRDFTLAERLLTEGRVLWDYLFHWFNPFTPIRGLFSDGYPLSHSLLMPGTTLPALLGVTLLVGWSLWARARHPLVSLAFLFFLGGHLMESSIVPLEIYFEHRNYLPSIFLALPIMAWLTSRPRWSTALWIGLTALLLIMALLTHRVAGIWGKELSLASWSVQVNPQSSRAWGYFATAISSSGRPDHAVRILDEAIWRFPENSHLHLHRLVEKCAHKGVNRTELGTLQQQLFQYPLEIRSMPLLVALADEIPRPGCLGLGPEDMLALLRVQVQRHNEHGNRDILMQLHQIEGKLLVKTGRPEAAIKAFSLSQNARASISVGMAQVALLASHGYLDQALAWLDRVERLPRPSTWREKLDQPELEAEIVRIRAQLIQDIRAQSSSAKGQPANPAANMHREAHQR